MIKRVYSFLSAMTIAMVLPGVSIGNAVAGGDCLVCGQITSAAQAMLANPTCKNDPTCVSCVQTAATQSQTGAQCGAATAAKKNSAGELIFATLNTAATVLCATACTMSLSVVASAATPAWSRACGWAGFGVNTAEVGYSLEQLIVGKEKADEQTLISLATQGYGIYSSLPSTTITAKQIAAYGVKKTKEGLEKSRTTVGKMLANPACKNAVLFGIAAEQKIKSVIRGTKVAQTACDNASAYSSNGMSPFQSCLGTPGALRQSTFPSGQFAATAETFTAPSIDDVNHLAATSNLNSGLKSLSADMQMAADQGKLDYGNIAKKIASGSDLSSILAGAGIAPDLASAIKSANDKVNSGDTSKLMAAMGQGYSSSAEGKAVANAEDTGIGNLSFGNSASPGEGAASLDIDRQPAGGTSPAALVDGDVFHGAYTGTIFDIVTYRLKAQKGNYAELDPEGRMNRLFNGYGEPGKKSARAPASLPGSVGR